MKLLSTLILVFLCSGSCAHWSHAESKKRGVKTVVRRWSFYRSERLLFFHDGRALFERKRFSRSCFQCSSPFYDKEIALSPALRDEKLKILRAFIEQDCWNNHKHEQKSSHDPMCSVYTYDDQGNLVDDKLFLGDHCDELTLGLTWP